MDFDLLFRVFYSGLYTVLLLALIVLLLITPGDGIRQALENRQLYNVFVIAGVYFLTVIFAVVIYASRLYTTRSTLAAIPKTWIPVEKGDVGKSVRKMIVEGLTRSAVVAWDAKPRLPLPDNNGSVEEIIDEKEIALSSEHRHHRLFHRKKKVARDELEKAVTLPRHHPVWGTVSHTGWASPLSSDQPDLEYVDVILELPHLLEAKVVSLVPTYRNEDGSVVPNSGALELIQRPITFGMRDYLMRLARLHILPASEDVVEFVTAYEHARFSSVALSETEFRHLLRMFAEILRVVSPLDLSLCEDVMEDDDNSSDDGESYSDESTSGVTTSDIQSTHSEVLRQSDRRGGEDVNHDVLPKQQPGVEVLLGMDKNVSAAQERPHELMNKASSVASNSSVIRTDLARGLPTETLRSNPVASIDKPSMDTVRDFRHPFDIDD